MRTTRTIIKRSIALSISATMLLNVPFGNKMAVASIQSKDGDSPIAEAMLQQENPQDEYLSMFPENDKQGFSDEGTIESPDAEPGEVNDEIVLEESFDMEEAPEDDVHSASNPIESDCEVISYSIDSVELQDLLNNNASVAADITYNSNDVVEEIEIEDYTFTQSADITDDYIDYLADEDLVYYDPQNDTVEPVYEDDSLYEEDNFTNEDIFDMSIEDSSLEEQYLDGDLLFEGEELKENVEELEETITEEAVVFSADEELVSVYEGTCGTDLIWKYVEDMNLLKIEGTGNMEDYVDSASTPWAAYRTSIKEIEIDNGVTSIGMYAFSNLISLEKASITDDITSIGFRAFYNCSSLNTINIPAGWVDCPTSKEGTTDSNYCGHIFEGCQLLSQISIPDQMDKIPSYGFCYCDYLENITLPNSITEIKNHTFYKCTKLKSIELPETVTYIGKSAFCYCNGLSNVTLQDGVVELALYAFFQCTALESVTLPDSIERIGYQAFAECSNLSEINVPRNWTECPTSNTNGTINADYCGHIFESCKQLTSIVISEGVTELPGYAFASCNYLQEVELPSSLLSIKNHTFYKCSNLLSISIPERVTSIGKSAFGYCSKLNHVELPDDITNISAYGFYECKALETLGIPDNVEQIGYQAFAYCSNLQNVHIPTKWTTCPSSSTSGTISTEYCGHIFEGCSSLKTVDLPAEWVSLPSYAFTACNYLEEISLPDGLNNISNHSFYGCTRLKAIDFPSGMTSINKSAFYNCGSLVEIVIPEGVASIGAYAFDSCSKLEDVQIADTVEKLGYRCFASCGNLSNINIPLSWSECSSSSSSGTRSSSYCGHIFEGCSSLYSIDIPEGLSAIPEYGFCYCNYIKEITLPETITEIRKCGFYYCTSLVNINFPETLSLIGEYCFDHCTSLRALNLNEGLTNINKSTFNSCTALAAISIPDSVSQIDNTAFDSCSILSNIYFGGTESQWENISNSTVLSNATVEYGVLCDCEEPSEILEYHYTKPQGVDIDNFYGGIISQTGHALIDVNKAFFGPNRKNLFVSIPKDSYITFGFEKAMRCPDNALILMTTTGNVNERADIYLETLSGTLEYVGTTYETNEYHTIQVGHIDDYITGIKVVGRDLDGDSPGFDVIDIMLIAGRTDYSANHKINTRVTMTRKGVVYNLLKEEQIFEKTGQEEATILVTADWGEVSKGTIMIIQDNDIILENKGGSFVDIQPAFLFEPQKKIYIAISDADGNIIEIRRTKLTILSDEQGEEITVTLDANGGNTHEAWSPTSYTMTFTVGGKYGYLPNPTRNGYRFAGWYTKKEGGTQITSSSVVQGSIKTLYARWKYSNIGVEVIPAWGRTFKAVFDQDYFNNSSSVSQDGLMMLSSLAAYSTYYKAKGRLFTTVCNPLEMLEQCGFDHTKAMFSGNGKEGGHSNALNYNHGYFYIGEREIINNEGNKELLIGLIISGYSEGGYEWVSNFNVGSQPYHVGFKSAAEEIVSLVKRYKDTYYDKEKYKKVKYWITGHSRGGALTNIVSLLLSDDKNVYAYGFATPRYIFNDYDLSGKHDNIINVISPDDFVPQVAPEEWGFKRYGQNVEFNVKYREKMKSRFLTCFKRDYDGYTTKKMMTLINAFTDIAASREEFNNRKYYIGGMTDVAGFIISQGDMLIPYEWAQGGIGYVMSDMMPLGVVKLAESCKYGKPFIVANALLVHGAEVTDNITDAHLMESYLMWLFSGVDLVQETAKITGGGGFR